MSLPCPTPPAGHRSLLAHLRRWYRQEDRASHATSSARAPAVTSARSCAPCKLEEPTRERAQRRAGAGLRPCQGPPGQDRRSGRRRPECLRERSCSPTSDTPPSESEAPWRPWWPGATSSRNSSASKPGAPSTTRHPAVKKAAALLQKQLAAVASRKDRGRNRRPARRQRRGQRAR